MERGDSNDGVEMPQNLTASAIYNGQTGQIDNNFFNEITFKKAGTYTFLITEDIPDEAEENVYQGYTYDASRWTLTVTVEDKDSKLKVTNATYAKAGTSDAEAAVFTNEYDLEPVEYAPKVQKSIAGAEVPEDINAEFDFTLKRLSGGPADGVDMTEASGNPETDEVKTQKITTADIRNGNDIKAFDTLTFTKAGNYTFQIAETAGDQSGYTYDGSIWNLKVTVEDKGGYLEVTNKTYTKANVTADQDNGEREDQAVFTNTYSVTPTAFTPQVEKQFSDDSVTRPTAKEFTFTLTADAKNPAGGAFTGYDETTGIGAPLEAKDDEGKDIKLATAVNGIGSASFDEITFTKAGTYVFNITETEGSDLGYTYDDAAWTLTVQVDDIGGELTVISAAYQSNKGEEAESNEQAAVFVNGYHYISSIIINKDVLHGDAAYETEDVFYAGIFRKVDSAGDTAGDQADDTQETGKESGNISYELVKNVVVGDQTVESGVVQLTNNSSVEVYVPLGGKDQTEAVTYYVFETDAEGHPLVSFDEEENVIYNQPSVYEISSESKGEDGAVNNRGEVYVTADGAEADRHPEMTITNRATSVSIEKRDISGNPLKGAVLELWKQVDSVDAGATADADRTKAGNGDILLETWTSDGTPHELTAELAVGGTYYLREAEVPAGYVQAADMLFTVESGEPITLVMEDENQAGVLGQIQVTKRLSTIDESTFDFVDVIAEDTTVYVGLFTDAQGEHPYGDDYIRPVRIQGASFSTVTYDGLPEGTYYVFETLEDGTVIPYGEVQNGTGAGSFACVSDSSSGAVKEITIDFDSDRADGATELTNVYYGDLPDGFSYQGEISITKSILKDGAPADSSDTFYAGIFTGETETAPYKVVTLKNNDTVTVEVPLGGENGMDPVTYYIYETDADGHKLDKSTFAYSVSGEGSVALDVDHTAGSRTIINTMASGDDSTRTIRPTDENDKIKSGNRNKTATTIGTDRRSRSTKTGDDSRIGLYLLFFGAAVAGILISLWKRRKYDE